MAAVQDLQGLRVCKKEGLKEGQEVIEAMKTQAEMVLLAHEMCSPSLLISFDTFLNANRGFLAVPTANTPLVEPIQEALRLHCPPLLVDLHAPPLILVPPSSFSSFFSSSSSPTNFNSKPGMAQFNLQPQALHGPGILGNLTNNNPIPACTLCKLAYIQMASTMTDEIAALTEDAHGPWACFFMAIKDDLENCHLYNATGSLCPIPDKAFYPTPATLALQYYLSGKMNIPPSHPFFSYRCFDCNHLEHWRWEHNE
ncbi:hypothetical protein J3A83DRAFT_4368867 [Scleroderma citrinum]